VKIKNRQQVLAIVAGIVVALFIADKVIIDPLINSWRQRTKQIAELRKKVDDGRSLVRREASLRSRWEQMRTNTLPNNSSLAEQQVLKAVDRWCQDSRITPTSISSQWKHDGEDYMTVEYRVEASGNLSAVARFLYEVEKDPMALRIQGAEISSHDNNGQQLSLGLQISGLVITPGGRQR